MGYKICIDGPSGAGKGYLASALANELDIINIDTGAMYRALALYCKNNNIDVESPQDVIDVLKSVDIKLIPENRTLRVFLNENDVSLHIRNEQIAMLATKVSSIPEVREYMKKRQREIAGNNNVITEGRDIGSVVFPDAELKIFLTADVNIRAERRYKELLLTGKNVTYELVLEDIKRRDENDYTRKISPLIKTKDMIEIDSTNLTRQQVVEKALDEVRKKGLI